MISCWRDFSNILPTHEEQVTMLGWGKNIEGRWPLGPHRPEIIIKGGPKLFKACLRWTTPRKKFWQIPKLGVILLDMQSGNYVGGDISIEGQMPSWSAPTSFRCIKMHLRPRDVTLRTNAD